MKSDVDSLLKEIEGMMELKPWERKLLEIIKQAKKEKENGRRQPLEEKDVKGLKSWKRKLLEIAEEVEKDTVTFPRKVIQKCLRKIEEMERELKLLKNDLAKMKG